MKKYLFVFGFETPQQKIANSTHGYDDEDSAAVFIQAENEEDALHWGKQIVKEAMKFLYRDNTLNWNPDDYAYWIEKNSSTFSDKDLKNIPEVSVGTFPDFRLLLNI